MLKAPNWRPVVMESLRGFLSSYAPNLLGENPIKPNQIQKKALEALEFYRTDRNYKKGVVILPTGTGKTILSALDVKSVGGRSLFLVHRLDILKQSIEAYKKVWPTVKVGVLTGEAEENVVGCDVLFASKDTLRQSDVLKRFGREDFRYVVVDEVHHGQSPSYKDILEYFAPHFMLGMTATPDRTDRKDIFELFDYNKVLEVTLQEAIEEGYLVPYTYFGLVDDVDYSRIRFQNNRYRVDDLERFLIIPERNEAILREYQEKGNGDKAIGFCCSVKHANRMAEFFNAHGVTAASITSETPDRDAQIAAFRDNKINVVFTVDLFNEGMDFPNVRVLLFLRPTESKTVFVQQLGRGLRLCVGKDRVTILDFIGNYKRANQIRKWLAKASKKIAENVDGRRNRKIEYTYATGCKVTFDPTVEEILDRQDESEIEVTKEDLKEAYFLLAEKIGRKPSQDDLNTNGQFKARDYVKIFGTWLKFLQEIGEYTEASYHYPQGVHLGHILSILKVFGGGSNAGTHFDDRYIRMRGGLGEGRLGAYQRQVKYKLQGAMELGILIDDRSEPSSAEYKAALSPKGKALYDAFRPLLDRLDVDFKMGDEDVPSTRMALGDDAYNAEINGFISKDAEARKLFLSIVLKMPAISQMASYLYQIERKAVVARADIYKNFFRTPFVKQYCDREGIDEATDESSKHRSPFLLNILEASGAIAQTRTEITVEKFLIAAPIIRAQRKESLEEADRRAVNLAAAWPSNGSALDGEQISLLRELFGPTFLTPAYYLKKSEYVHLF
jgi:superfamily II DNA or RNA helicase